MMSDYYETRLGDLRDELEDKDKEIDRLEKCITKIDRKLHEVYRCLCENKTYFHDVHGCCNCQNLGVIPEDEFSAEVYFAIKELEGQE